MIVRTETEVVKTEINTEIRCDLCNVLQFPTETWPTPAGSPAAYPIATEVAMKPGRVGASFLRPKAGLGQGVRKSFHICASCFESELVPWMKSRGASPTIEQALVL